MMFFEMVLSLFLFHRTFDNDLSVNIVNSRQSRFERIKTALHITTGTASFFQEGSLFYSLIKILTNYSQTERRQWMALGFVSTVFILIIIAAI